MMFVSVVPHYPNFKVRWLNTNFSKEPVDITFTITEQDARELRDGLTELLRQREEGE